MTVLRECSAPQGLFPGTNFMTPRILAYYKLRLGYAELSEGEGMDHEPIFGVTVRPESDPKRSRLFHSRQAALVYIEELS